MSTFSQQDPLSVKQFWAHAFSFSPYTSIFIYVLVCSYIVWNIRKKKLKRMTHEINYFQEYFKKNSNIFSSLNCVEACFHCLETWFKHFPNFDGLIIKLTNVLKAKYTFRVRFIVIHGVAKSVFPFLYDFSYFWLIFHILRVRCSLVYPVLMKSLCSERKRQASCSSVFAP